MSVLDEKQIFERKSFLRFIAVILLAAYYVAFPLDNNFKASVPHYFSDKHNVIARVINLRYADANQDSNTSLYAAIESEHCTRIEARDNICYRNNGRFFEILDISDASYPSLISKIYLSSGISDFIIYDNYAIITDSDSGAFIYDLSNPETPVKIGTIHLDMTSPEITCKDSIIYFSEALSGICAYDISNISQPAEIGSYRRWNIMSNIAEYRGKLYVPSFSPEGLYVLNANRDAIFEELGYLSTPAVDISAVVAKDSILYGGGRGSVVAINIQLSDSMYIISEYDYNSDVFDMTIKDTCLYLASGQNGLRILSIANPDSLLEVAHFPATPHYYTKGIFSNGNYAYLANNYGGMQIVDVSNLPNIHQVSIYSTGFKHQCLIYGAYADGDNVYLADAVGYLHSVNVSESGDLTIIDSIRVGIFPDAVYVKNNVAYVTSSDTLFIVDISNPESLEIINKVSEFTYAWGIYVNSNYAYVADEGAGLYILDVTDPQNAQVISSYPMEFGASTVYVTNDTAYVAAEDAGLLILDVSDPIHPREIGSIDTDSHAWGVWAQGNYAYVADDADGLLIIDVTYPQNPQIITAYNTGISAWYVQIVGNLAYVADQGGGLRIIDISDPYNPREYGRFFDDGASIWVHVVGDKAYLPSGRYGLRIASIHSGQTSVKEFSDSIPSGNNFNSYPNPFNSTTVFSYRLDSYSHIKLSIYNLKGQLVRDINQGLQQSGAHLVKWNAEGLSSGEYIAVLSIEKDGMVRKEAKKILLMK